MSLPEDLLFNLGVEEAFPAGCNSKLLEFQSKTNISPPSQRLLHPKHNFHSFTPTKYLTCASSCTNYTQYDVLQISFLMHCVWCPMARGESVCLAASGHHLKDHHRISAEILADDGYKTSSLYTVFTCTGTSV